MFQRITLQSVFQGDLIFALFRYPRMHGSPYPLMKPKTRRHVDTLPSPNTHSNIHTYRHHNALVVVTNFSSIKASGSGKLW